MANPAWVKGMAAPNPGGKSTPMRKAAKGLAFACQEAASDEEIADWLLTIAIEGKWPEGRRGKKMVNAAAERERAGLEMIAAPPDGTHRMAALKEFLLRRDGQPMQAILVKAEVEARERALRGGDIIDVEALDPLAAAALEATLMRAVGPRVELDDEETES